MATFILDPATHTTASVPRLSRQNQKQPYFDKQFQGGQEEWKILSETSSTVYVGNLSCYTNEYQLHELFSRCGSIKRIIMGLDKIKKTPCGFCFIEFDERDSALKSIKFLNRTHLDGRDIQVNLDAGFQESRQFGRGSHGGQLGDERRRERDRSGHGPNQGSAGSHGMSQILTRSITIVAFLAVVILIASPPSSAMPSSVLLPFHRTQYFNSNSTRRAVPFNETKVQFERNLAQFLVNVIKSSKPSLIKAFIQATLADKQLREIAIAMFFNNNGSEDED